MHARRKTKSKLCSIKGDRSDNIVPFCQPKETKTGILTCITRPPALAAHKNAVVPGVNMRLDQLS